jgi:hypothetical protein
MQTAAVIGLSLIVADGLNENRENIRTTTDASPGVLIQTWFHAVQSHPGHWEEHFKDFRRKEIGYNTHDRKGESITGLSAEIDIYTAIARRATLVDPRRDS